MFLQDGFDDLATLNNGCAAFWIFWKRTIQHAQLPFLLSHFPLDLTGQFDVPNLFSLTLLVTLWLEFVAFVPHLPTLLRAFVRCFRNLPVTLDERLSRISLGFELLNHVVSAAKG